MHKRCVRGLVSGWSLVHLQFSLGVRFPRTFHDRIYWFYNNLVRHRGVFDGAGRFKAMREYKLFLYGAMLVSAVYITGSVLFADAAGAIDTSLATACNPTCTSITQSFVTNAPDTLLIVTLGGYNNGSGQGPTGATYNGVTMNAIDDNGAVTNWRNETFYLSVPDVGTHDVVGTFGGAGYWTLGVSSYTGISSADALDDHGSCGTVALGTCNFNITTASSDDIVIGLSVGSSDTWVPYNGETVQSDQTTANGELIVQDKQPSVAGVADATGLTGTAGSFLLYNAAAFRIVPVIPPPEIDVSFLYPTSTVAVYPDFDNYAVEVDGVLDPSHSYTLGISQYGYDDGSSARDSNNVTRRYTGVTGIGATTLRRLDYNFVGVSTTVTTARLSLYDETAGALAGDEWEVTYQKRSPIYKSPDGLIQRDVITVASGTVLVNGSVSTFNTWNGTSTPFLSPCDNLGDSAASSSLDLVDRSVNGLGWVLCKLLAPDPQYVQMLGNKFGQFKTVLPFVLVYGTADSAQYALANLAMDSSTPDFTYDFLGTPVNIFPSMNTFFDTSTTATAFDAEGKLFYLSALFIGVKSIVIW